MRNKFKKKQQFFDATKLQNSLTNMFNSDDNEYQESITSAKSSQIEFIQPSLLYISSKQYNQQIYDDDMQSIQTHLIELQAKHQPFDLRKQVKDSSKYPYNCVGKVIATFKVQNHSLSTTKTSIKDAFQTKIGIASLIGPGILITSAHVLVFKQRDKQIYPIKIQFTIQSLSEDGKFHWVSLNIKKHIIHQDYFKKGYRQFCRCDFALLQLQENKVIHPKQYLKIKWDYTFAQYEHHKVKLITFKQNNLNSFVRVQQDLKPQQQKSCILTYVHTSYNGDSGTPVLLIIQGDKNDDFYMIGIHKGTKGHFNFCILLSSLLMKTTKDIFSEIVEQNNLLQAMKTTNNYIQSGKLLLIQNKNLQKQCQELKYSNNSLSISLQIKQQEFIKKNNQFKHIEQKYNQLKRRNLFKQNQKQSKSKSPSPLRKIYDQSLKKTATKIISDPNTKINKIKQQSYQKQFQDKIQILQDQLILIKSKYQRSLQQIKNLKENKANEILSYQKLFQESNNNPQPSSNMLNEKQIQLKQNYNINQQIQMDLSSSLEPIKEEIQDEQKNKQKEEKKCKQFINKMVDAFKRLLNLPTSQDISQQITNPTNREEFVKLLIQKRQKKSWTDKKYYKNNQLQNEYKKDLQEVFQVILIQIYLGLDNLSFKMKDFVNYEWKQVIQMRLINCGLGNQDWDCLVNNIANKKSSFSKLKVLKIQGNSIKVVTRKQLQCLKSLQKIWFRDGAGSSNNLTRQSIIALDWFYKNSKIQLLYK